MKILLIGKSGQLGQALLKVGSPHHLIVAPDRTQLDLERVGELPIRVGEVKPDGVINTAAFHNVPLCDVEWEKAFRVNCVAVRTLARACAEQGAWFMTFSTDYVFGGDQRTPYREDDPPNPLQMYGISKLAGEYAARAVAPAETIIVRTCGLYGISGAQSKGGNFLDKCFQEARRNVPLEIACEQVVAPTFAEDLAVALVRLLEKGRPPSGTYHLVNEGECTWHEFAKTAFEILRQSVDLRPIDRKGMRGGVRRPLYSVLGNRKARSLGIVLPPWRDALKRYLQLKCGI
jgi:dTDP-4-dehydrorhamnose reductase